MAVKKVEIVGVGNVTLQKNARNRSIRLTVGSNGEVRVSMPRWTPYAAGVAFAKANVPWIVREQTTRAPKLLANGQRIGKQHYLRFEYAFGLTDVATRVTTTEIIVRYGSNYTPESPAVQAKAKTAAERALKAEANSQLAPRLAELAGKHDLAYKDMKIKLLKRRWGSCSSEQSITFNLYLMELPWHLIDYVILHELTHTQHLHHGPNFWKFLTGLEPTARQRSRELRNYQPAIGTIDNTIAL